MNPKEGKSRLFSNDPERGEMTRNHQVVVAKRQLRLRNGKALGVTKIDRLRRSKFGRGDLSGLYFSI